MDEGSRTWRWLALAGVLVMLVSLVKVLGPDTYVAERKCGPAISVVVRGPVITDGSTPPAGWVDQCHRDARATALPWLGVLMAGGLLLGAGLKLRPAAS